MSEKPHAPATERNRDAILAVLRNHLDAAREVLEIGSGTGQHAVYFAQALPQLTWQCSDRAEYLPGIRAWLGDAQLANTPPPIELDVTGTWPQRSYDAVFSANTLHIMPWTAVEQLFAGLRQRINPGGRLVIYGPFNYGGQFTSQSNADFDRSLRADHPERGIRDFERVEQLADGIRLELLDDIAMPANNRCLVWRKPL